MKLKPIAAIAIAVVITIAGIAVTTAFGWWSTKTTKTPVKYEQTELSGQYNPADIRGSYSFAEISDLFNIPIEDIATAYGLSASEAKTLKCKDLEGRNESAYDIGTGSVRMFVAFYLGLPTDLSADTYVPASAAQVLREKGSMTQEQSDYLADHTAE